MKLSKEDRQRIKTVGIEAKKLRHAEEQKRQGWLDDLKKLSARQGLLTLEEIVRVSFILRRIIEESKPPQSLPWPYRFTSRHLKEIKKFPGLLGRFRFLEELCFHGSHGEMLVDAKWKAQSGDDDALIRLIEWNPLFLCEEWVRDRVAEAIWKGEKPFLKKIGKMFPANKRLRSKMKQRDYISRVDDILLNLEWLGLLEKPADRKKVQGELVERFDSLREKEEAKAAQLDAAGRTRAATKHKKEAELAKAAKKVVADASTYFKLLRAARVFSGREKLSVKS